MRIIRTLLCAAAILSIGGITTIARADDKKDIQAVYERVAKAMMNKDVNGIMATGTDGFSYTEGGQTMTGEQIKGMMTGQFASVVGKPKVKFKVVSLKITGKTAAAVVTDSSEMTIKGADGKTHKITSDGKSNDTLVKTDKGWLMKSVNIVSSKMTQDGKPMEMPAAGK